MKREREFFKDKKYKDYGFESMLNYKGGGLKEATKKLKAQGLKKGGFVARGCGAIMSNRKKKTRFA